MTNFILAAAFASFLAEGVAAANPQVYLHIAGSGQMTIELYPAKAPKTVAHFLSLVDSKFYDGILFHRVVNQPRPYIAVTGDPLTKTLPLDDPRIGTGGSGTKVPFEENSLPFLNGTLGLVRELKNKNSGDSQFFICNGDQRFLEDSYVAFGKVVDGLDLIPKIKRGDKIVSIRRK